MSNQTTLNAPQWYVIYTHPRQEDRTNGNLTAWGIETFAPKIRDQRTNPFTGRKEYQVKHLFPRYIFARFDASELVQKIRFTRGVNSIVTCGENLAPVSDEIIEAIRLRIGSNGYVKIGEELRPGDKVLILNGSLRNFLGVFERPIDDSERIRILLTTINYQAHIEIDRQEVKRA
jgi:Transcription antiterminator